MSGIIQSNTCPVCGGVIFSFDFDKEKSLYKCKSCGHEFAAGVVDNDRDLDPKDRIGGYMNQSGVELAADTLQGEQQVAEVVKNCIPQNNLELAEDRKISSNKIGLVFRLYVIVLMLIGFIAILVWCQ